MLKKGKRLWAVLLAASLLMGHLGATAYAEGRRCQRGPV